LLLFYIVILIDNHKISCRVSIFLGSIIINNNQKNKKKVLFFDFFFIIIDLTLLERESMLKIAQSQVDYGAEEFNTMLQSIKNELIEVNNYQQATEIIKNLKNRISELENIMRKENPFEISENNLK